MLGLLSATNFAGAKSRISVQMKMEDYFPENQQATLAKEAFDQIAQYKSVHREILERRSILWEQAKFLGKRPDDLLEMWHERLSNIASEQPKDGRFEVGRIGREVAAGLLAEKKKNLALAREALDQVSPTFRAAHIQLSGGYLSAKEENYRRAPLWELGWYEKKWNKLRYWSPPRLVEGITGVTDPDLPNLISGSVIQELETRVDMLENETSLRIPYLIGDSFGLIMSSAKASEMALVAPFLKQFRDHALNFYLLKRQVGELEILAADSSFKEGNVETSTPSPEQRALAEGQLLEFVRAQTSNEGEVLRYFLHGLDESAEIEQKAITLLESIIRHYAAAHDQAFTKSYETRIFPMVVMEAGGDINGPVIKPALPFFLKSLQPIPIVMPLFVDDKKVSGYFTSGSTVISIETPWPNRDTVICQFTPQYKPIIDRIREAVNEAEEPFRLYLNELLTTQKGFL